MIKKQTYDRTLLAIILLSFTSQIFAQWSSSDYETAIRSLEKAERQVIDAPRKVADGFGISVQNHTNGMARVGPWWITNYPNVHRKEGRILFWNENEDDYEAPHTFDTEGGYPAGMDAANNILAVTYAKSKILFFEFPDDSGLGRELQSYDAGGRNDSVGLAYHPGRQTYYLLLKRTLYSGSPGAGWRRVGIVNRTKWKHESQPLVYLGNDTFAAFALGPDDKTNSAYKFTYSIFTVRADGTIVNGSSDETVILENRRRFGGEPSFRWGGTVTLKENTLTLYAAPKRLDASGNYYYWTAKIGGSKPYTITIKTGNKRGAGTNAKIYVTIVGDNGPTKERYVNEHISGNAFEKGESDALTLRMSDVGNVKSLIVRSNNRGVGPAWYLSKIIVNSETFTCNCWVDGDNKVRRISKD